jgi:hypothetical protein
MIMSGAIPEFMTVSEVAELLQVRESWVYSHADELGVCRLGKYLRFYRPRVMETLVGPAKSSKEPKSIDPRS